MSATLGDVTELAADLSRRNGRETVLVTDAERPVPLTLHLVAHAAGRDARGAGHHPPGAGLRRALHPEGRRRARDRPAQRQARHRRRGRAEGAAGRLPVRRRLRQDPRPSCCAGGSACTTPGCCRATGAWSSSSPRPGCSPSSAAPTPSASASTCRSAPCCSPASRSTTATAAGSCGSASSTRSPAAPGGPGFDTSGYVVVQAPEHTIENEKAKAKSAAKNAAMCGGEAGQAQEQGPAAQAARGHGRVDRADLREARSTACPRRWSPGCGSTTRC